MEYLGYLLLAGVVGFVGYRFYIKVATRKSGSGTGGRPPRDGGSNQQQ